jgi:hypothetical protein
LYVSFREADSTAESLGSSRLPESSHSIEESQGGQDYQQNKSENRAEYDLVRRRAPIDRASKSLHKFVDPLANHSGILLSISSGGRRHAPFVIRLLAVIMLGKSAAFGPPGWSVGPLRCGMSLKRRGFLCVEKLALPPPSNVSMSKTLHSYLKRLRRRTICFSRSEELHDAVIKLFVHHSNTSQHQF